jgi:hypothetical protein
LGNFWRAGQNSRPVDQSVNRVDQSLRFLFALEDD